MFEAFAQNFRTELEAIDAAGLTKHERLISTPQGAAIRAQPGGEVINFCANNYLGLSSHPKILEAAHRALDEFGFGMSSVRFICGTQTIHTELESAISKFLGQEATILYPSAFDANGGLFETILTADDAIISDQLNHASIIDGIRLSKASRHRYPNGDMNALEDALKATQNHRMRLIATDGVFSMDGCYAKLDEICNLAERYNAMVMMDECHATGFVGTTGRGTHEKFDVMGRVDIITGTLGKALGGASGGFTSAKKPIVDLLRQRSRPYLFSNTVAPPIVGASLAVFEMLAASTERRDRLEENTVYFRGQMSALGFDIPDGDHPITPVMLGDARLAATLADDLLAEGIYVIGFSYPVVPKGQARIRVQLSAAHERAHLDQAIAAFAKVGRAHGVI